MSQRASVTLHRKVQVWIHGRDPKRSGQPLFLLLRMRPERGGYWQPVTGNLEGDETLEQAALREAREETALVFASLPRPLGEPFEFRDRWGRDVREFSFDLEVAEDTLAPTGAWVVRLDPHEHVASRWVKADEAMSLLHFDSHKKIFNALLQRCAVAGG